MILADKIIELRKKNGWSQEQLAEQMDISRQSVSKWESGMSIPDLDKIIKMSNLFGVSTDYLLKDEIEEMQPGEVTGDGIEEEVRRVSVEEANTYMDTVRKVAPKMTFGIVLCILSIIPLLYMGALAEYKNTGLTEDMAGGIGMVITLVLVAIGVVPIILSSMKLSKYEYLEKEMISLEYGVKGIVEKRKKDYEEKYRTGLVTGIVICILSMIPLFVAAAMNAGDYIYAVCLCIMFAIVAIGVCFIVSTGLVWGSYTKLLQEGDYTEENKDMERKTEFFSRVYWCIITAIYLGISFYTFEWHRTWIIWPVAGVFFAACRLICYLVVSKKKAA